MYLTTGKRQETRGLHKSVKSRDNAKGILHKKQIKPSFECPESQEQNKDSVTGKKNDATEPEPLPGW